MRKACGAAAWGTRREEALSRTRGNGFEITPQLEYLVVAGRLQVMAFDAWTVDWLPRLLCQSHNSFNGRIFYFLGFKERLGEQAMISRGTSRIRLLLLTLPHCKLAQGF